jgi:hypothetical protein
VEDIMRRSPLGLLSILAAAGLATAALAVTQTRTASDQRRQVSGWVIEDIAEPTDDDPTRRVIRMTRQVGGQRLAYEVAFFDSGFVGEDGSEATSGNCSQSLLPLESQPAGLQARSAASARAALARELARFETFCGLPSGGASILLDSFEEGFAVLSTWRRQRLAEYDEMIAGNSPAPHESNDVNSY